MSRFCWVSTNSLYGHTRNLFSDNIEQNSVSNLNIQHCAKNAYFELGGFIGSGGGDASSLLSNNYVTGKIVVCDTLTPLNQSIGGFIGRIHGDFRGHVINNNYAAVSLQETPANIAVGGFIGEKRWSNSPQAAGNLWDIIISGVNDSVQIGRNGIQGVSTENLMSQSWLENAGWDFAHVWELQESYPKLIWEGAN